MEDFVC